jgi:hypothetical protein
MAPGSEGSSYHTRSLSGQEATDASFACSRLLARSERRPALIAKEIVHAVTSLDAKRAAPADLAALARGQWAIEAVHWIRDTAYREDHSAGYAGDGPQVMAALRNMAISLLHIAGITQIARTLQAFSRDRTRILDVIPL